MIRNCNYCNEEYDAEPRYLNRNQGLFCSQECSGKFHHPKLVKESNTECAYCQAKFYKKPSSKKSKSGLYFCSREHQGLAFSDKAILVQCGPKASTNHKYCDCCGVFQGRHATAMFCRPCKKEITIFLWLLGNSDIATGKGYAKEPRKWVKEYLIATRGDKCEVCGFDEKAPDGRSIIQMDHIDGNSLNNLITNLRLLCPNHHAMTETYGSLNKNGGRAHRRKQ